MIGKAWRSLSERNEQLAAEVIDADAAVDQQEVRIEEECLKILALHQPVAIDLRRTATILKVNNDLERIADLAVNIAERASAAEQHAQDFEIPVSLAHDGRVRARDAGQCADGPRPTGPGRCVEVCAADDEVDRCNAEVVTDLYQVMMRDPAKIAPSIHCLAVAPPLGADR